MLPFYILYLHRSVEQTYQVWF